MYPEIEPYDHGMLDVGDGNRMYWEVCGAPNGKPAVVFHGGPGSGCTPAMRQYFDPNAYRLVLFDQRGCGRSKPHASDPATDLSTNTTEHLLGDIERLREHVGIDRWLVFGGSWGSTLALAYAERNPHRVTEMIIPGVTTSRRSEFDWLTRGLGVFFPEQWERFRDNLPERDRHGDLAAAYHRLLESPDPAVREKAAWDWSLWDLVTITGGDSSFAGSRYADPQFRMAKARIVTHYFSNMGFLEDGILLREAAKLAAIPAVLIHGRRDFGSPLITAWELARAWPDAELVVIENAGHAYDEPGMVEAVLGATERFAHASGTSA